MNAEPTIVLQAVEATKQYKMGNIIVEALRGTNLSVHKGEFVAVMGPSGSGKSTLLHLLGGLDTPSSGEIYLAGQPLSRLNDRKLTLLRLRKVGFIFQFYNLLPTQTALENVALPLLIDGKRMRQQRPWVGSMMERVGLSDRINHRPDQLSGGQQQRVAIARAFITKPEIVLADEPTGNLDSKSGIAVLELLKQACQELTATIVMVTHEARAASFAHRIVFLKDGLIVSSLSNAGEKISMDKITTEINRLENN
ncbi:MAG: ABC transporter ATP-binding protein [Anaerolineales bacterium]|nr:ABC transporter ATP-binding protein [Anaerolineales bacterium]